nr:hypothetical protein [bacterium]
RIFLAWYLSAAAFLAVVALKAPHYLIILLIPSYLMIGSYIYSVVIRLPDIEEVRALVPIVLTVLVMANIGTWNYRFIQHEPDDAMLETIKFFASELKGQVQPVVLTEETLGVMLPENAIYWNLHYRRADAWIISTADYVVLYNTLTQDPPDSPLIEELLQHAVLIRQFEGFKETIRIYQIVGGPQGLPTVKASNHINRGHQPRFFVANLIINYEYHSLMTLKYCLRGMLALYISRIG